MCVPTFWGEAESVDPTVVPVNRREGVLLLLVEVSPAQTNAHLNLQSRDAI